MDELENEDYEDVTIGSLKAMKKTGFRIICDGRDITDDIGDVDE